MNDTHNPDAFGEWVILELLGHRRLAGHLTERQIAGASFLQLMIPSEDHDPVTQWYSPSAVYAIHPVGEGVARSAAEAFRPAPVHRWELTPAAAIEEGPF